MSPSTTYEHFESKLGMANAGEMFSRFNEIGNAKLAEMRQEITSPLDVKEPRIYGITEAAKLIGRSETWLRDNVPNAPRAPNGRRLYSMELIHQLRNELGTNFQRDELTKAIVMAISNFKGGVAKTTSTVHAAHYYTTMKGMRVLVIDLDPQASSTFALGPFIPDLELVSDDTIYKTLIDDPDHNPIRQTYVPGLDIIPANLAIQDLDLSLPNPGINNSDYMGSPLRRLKTFTDKLRGYYDLILIDCPPNVGSVTANALVACNALLIPVPPAIYDLASFVMFSQTISDLFKGVDKKLDYARMLITNHPGSKASRKMESEIRALYPEFVLSNRIVHTTEVEKACEKMTSIYELNKPLTNRDTYQRALNSFNAVFEEMHEDFLGVWAAQTQVATEVITP